MPKMHARVGEDAFKRRKELKEEDEKRWQPEAFLLYCLILLWTWGDSLICRKSIRELCELYDLDYDNSMRRYKLLRKLKWVEVIKGRNGGIRPLVGIEKTVKSTDKTVKSTVFDCKVYSENDPKTVKSTVSPSLYTETFQNSELPEHTTQQNGAAGVSVSFKNSPETNGHKSRFTITECLAYVDVCIEKGEDIRNRHGLATSIFKSGEYDPFIEAALNPEIEKQAREADEERKQNCPRCHGSGGGWETVYDEAGNELGSRKCKHEPLTENDFLWKWQQKQEQPTID
ncbi:MAG TPA: hypothetical protein VF599_12660 [Pyrinomonadaceae bacterium]|jgi:hypothetical protein